MRLSFYKDSYNYITDEVSSVPTCDANLDEENRIKFVTDLAAISRGNYESKNPEVRYKRLMREAAPNKIPLDGKAEKAPSRPMEFLPVVFEVTFSLTHVSLYVIHDGDSFMSMDLSDFINNIAKFSYLVEDPVAPGLYKVYTNMRACVNAGIPYDIIPYNNPEDLKDFVAIRAMLPMFVWAQTPNTHTLISKEAQSDRVSKNNNYWLPDDFMDRVKAYHEKHDYSKKSDVSKELLDKAGNKDGSYPSKISCQLTLCLVGLKDLTQVQNILVYGRNNLCSPTQHDVQTYFKELGYQREIYSRAMYYFKYKEVVMTGWKNDPKVWDHLLLEREVWEDKHKSWVQDETKQFVKAVNTLINKGDSKYD